MARKELDWKPTNEPFIGWTVTHAHNSSLRMEVNFADLPDWDKLKDPLGTDSVNFKIFAHGIKQKVADKAALQKGATPREKFEAMQIAWKNLTKGIWSMRREAEPVIKVSEVLAKVMAIEDETERKKKIEQLKDLGIL